MQIELLYFDGCPSWRIALDNLRAVLAESDAPIDVKLTRVESNKQAIEARFVGSPTIRLDGVDLFPVGHEDHEDYALGCRVYHTPDGLLGWPTVEMIRSAMSERGIG